MRGPREKRGRTVHTKVCWHGVGLEGLDYRGVVLKVIFNYEGVRKYDIKCPTEGGNERVNRGK